MDARQRRIVLLGKTGAGKSSLVNTILGQSVFGVSHTADSETSECQAVTREVHGRTITIADTPGFFDSKKSESKELKAEILKCITECSPGPHAFLILLKVDKFTDQENKVISKIKESFSKEAFKHAVVVFTHGDQLPDGMKIEQFFGNNKNLQDLLEKCGGRCHVVDNKYWNNNQQDEYRNNQVQVEALLNTIDSMVMKNRGGYYTNAFFQAVERLIQEEEKCIRQTAGAGNMSDVEIREQAKRNIRKNIMKKAAGISIGVLLGALLGVPLMVSTAVKALKKIARAAVIPAKQMTRAGVTAVVARAVAAGTARAVAGAAAGAETAAAGAAAAGATGATATAAGAAGATATAAGAAGATATAAAAAGATAAGAAAGAITAGVIVGAAAAGAVAGGRTGY